MSPQQWYQWHLHCCKKPCSKNVNGVPKKGHQVSVMAQDNLKLAAFLSHYSWRCIYDWEVTKVQKSTICKPVRQKTIKDKCKGPDVLPKVNKANVVGWWQPLKNVSDHIVVIESTLCLGHMKDHNSPDLWHLPMLCNFRRKMIVIMLHLPTVQNMLCMDQETNIQEYTK